MSSFSISFQKDGQPHVKAKRWCLDFPAEQEQYVLADLMGHGVTFKGWVLGEPNEPCQIELQQHDKSVFIAFNIPRPDVIKALLQQEPDSHPQLVCGFSFQYPLYHDVFSIWFHQAGQRELLWRGRVTGTQPVLKGTKNWLFLDNDTNQSVEQFQGKKLIDSANLESWQQYFLSLHESSTQHAYRYAVLIAPSKEAVYPQFYPYKRAVVTPIDQLIEAFQLVYPLEELDSEDPYSFFKTDTHWSIHGAKLATLAVLSIYGLEKTAVEKLLLQDTFRRVYKVGDLGIKLFPPFGADEWVCANFSMYSAMVYDNGLPNFGRLMVFHKADAVFDASCLVFGASSSYSMLAFLCRIFKRVTFIHTAGNVDPLMIEAIQPNYVLCQTNERYITRAPDTNYCVRKTIKDKWQLLAAENKKEICEKRQKMLSKNALSWLAELNDWLPIENSVTSSD